MKQLFKTLSYTVEHCYYLIQPTKTALNVKFEDFDSKINYSCKITNELLPESIDITKIYQEMVKQHIYSNKQPSRMLRYQKGNLIVSFDYPRCDFRRFQFACQRRSTNQFQIRLEQVKKYFQQTKEEMKQLSQRFIIQLQQRTFKQLQKIDKIIEEKLHQITTKIDSESEMKLREFQQFYISNKKQHKEKLQQAIEQSVIQVISGNQTAIKEFRFVNSHFESALLTLQSNINSLHQSLEELRDDMDQDKEQTQDQITDVSVKIEEIAKAIWKNLKEVTEHKQINRQGQSREWESAYEGAESSVSEDMFPKLSAIKQESHHEKTKFLDKGGIGPPLPNEAIQLSKEVCEYPEPSLK